MTTDALATNASPLAQTQPHPLQMLQSMIDKGCDPDSLSKMMDLARQFRADQASEHYGEMFAEFQRRCIPIVESDNAGDRFKFASYERIMAQIGPLLADCNMSIQWVNADFVDGGKYRVEGFIRCGVHKEPIGCTVPIPDQLRVQETQKCGAAMSYGKRYALILGLNLPIVAETADAPPPAIANKHMDTITEDQVAVIQELIEETKSDRKKFLEFAGVKSISEMTKAKYAECKSLLESKRSTRL